jgi:hypothetical protein
MDTYKAPTLSADAAAAIRAAGDAEGAAVKRALTIADAAFKHQLRQAELGRPVDAATAVKAVTQPRVIDATSDDVRAAREAYESASLHRKLVLRPLLLAAGSDPDSPSSR